MSSPTPGNVGKYSPKATDYVRIFFSVHAVTSHSTPGSIRTILAKPHVVLSFTVPDGRATPGRKMFISVVLRKGGTLAAKKTVCDGRPRLPATL
jgi:hypothetical protein